MHRAVAFFTAVGQAAAMIKYHPGVSFLPSKAIEAQTTCIHPANFTVDNLIWWTPTAARNGTASRSLSFAFADPATEVTASCQYNSSSQAVNPTGNTPRYACSDPAVEFIWESTSSLLVLVERLCPNANGTASEEVSGEATLELQCAPTGCNSTFGDGLKCFTAPAELTLNYTAIDPVQPTSLER